MREIWAAPAKLNLFLHITGRRADGYHNLQTLFQFIDLQDELAFQVRSDGQLICHTELPGVKPQDNLIWRAAHLLQQTAQTPQGADIWLEKRIPSGGGLGGGSSDAATTLLALNQLWGLHYTQSQLAALGLQLGADVPVFIQGVATWASGVGEQFFPVEQLDTPYYCVLHPNCEISTGAIFQHEQLTRNTKPIKMPRFVELDTLWAHTHNDCEALVCREYPAVQTALEWLKPFAPARLTGTGACVFAPFTTASAAQQALAALPKAWQGWLVQGLNQSPAVSKRKFS